MKFKTNTEEFKRVIEKCNKVIPKKPSIAILEYVKITICNNKMQISVTDLNNSAYMAIDVDNIVDLIDIQFLLNDTKMLAKGMKFFKDNFITFEIEYENNKIKNNKIKLMCGSKELTQKIKLDTKIFPDEENFEMSKNFIAYDYNINKLKKRYDLIKYARAKNNQTAYRTILEGIHFNNNDMVTTDGYRLAINIDKDFNVKTPFTISHDVLQLLSSLFNDKIHIHMEINNKIIVFSDDYTVLKSKLLEGEYFKYENCIPNAESNVEINIKDFQENLKYLKTFIDAKHTAPIKWLNNKLSLCHAKGEYKTEVEIKGNFKSAIGFNCNYMLDGLSQFKDNIVKCTIIAPNSPIKIVDDENIALILPIKLEE